MPCCWALGGPLGCLIVPLELHVVVGSLGTLGHAVLWDAVHAMVVGVVVLLVPCKDAYSDDNCSRDGIVGLWAQHCTCDVRCH